MREGQPEVIVLPPTSLSPGEPALLDMRDAWRRAGSFENAVAVGAEFDYNTAPGTVVMTAASVTTDLNHHFQVPLIDPETPPSSTGGYPWRAEGTGTTVVYLKNTTTVPQQYVLQLTSEGGGYAPGLKTLLAGETVALDVRQLRDQNVSDAFGRTIPAAASSGQVHWSAKGRERFAIIGRAEYVDLDRGMSASYACLNCCPDHPYAWWNTPEVITVGVGDTAEVSLMLQDEDCYNTQLEPYGLNDWYTWPTWSISNTSIATGDSNSLIVGESEGTTTFSATWDNSAFYTVEGTESGWYCAPDWFPIEYEAETQAQEPTLSVSPSTVTRGQSATFTLAFPPESTANLANWTISNWKFISGKPGR
jgi:hypothetical protein